MKAKKGSFQKAELALEYFIINIINALFSNQGIEIDRAVQRFEFLLKRVDKIRRTDFPTGRNRKDDYSNISKLFFETGKYYKKK